ncbi:MAG: FMN-binding protein [Bacteroidota bacterium]|nr:FMN-binding protein [Bacteroidota bacterium]
MKAKYLIPLVLLGMWNCKQQDKKSTPDPISIEIEKPRKQSQEMESIAQYLGISPSDSVNIENRIHCWAIDENKNVANVDFSNAINLFKKISKTGKSDVYPIFGTKTGKEVLIIMSNQGFGGNIRGVFLIDKSNLEIKKVEFDHVAESEGYGAAITLSTFESQFEGTMVNFSTNTYGLKQNGKIIIPGSKLVDGISGATITSRLTVEMINDNLKKYKVFFE